MEYRTLGRSGLVVSSYALGTMTFGAETALADAHDQLDEFVGAGGTLIDTADVYSGGVAEETIGAWLRHQPPAVIDQVVLATKARFATGPGANDVGLSRRHLRRALDASLARLGVDHVDLYQVHAWDTLTPVEEWMGFLDEAVRSGRVSYVGLSNLTGWQTQKVVDVADCRGYPRPVSMQPQYNLLAREIEWEIVPVCRAEGLGLLPWSPLGGGWLTGKYGREKPPTGSTRLGEDPDRGVEAYSRRAANPRTWAVLDRLTHIAARLETTPAVVALAWLHDRPGVSSVVLGARTVDQLTANLAAVGRHLEPADTDLLDRASDPGAADYPYGSLGLQQRTPGP